jgi:hypothetical protein
MRSKSCEIIYVKQSDGSGWKWRSIETDEKPEVSEQTFELFYECVAHARKSGYQPNQKCL